LAAVLVLTGAGIGASVTLRQVRATRDQIRETATASRNQLKLSEQGQVTDRYTRAVEQLGHEKAPVRLGAMYSLDHLAQDNPEYRQTVVDVVCAYLRMPYTLPAQSGLGAEQVEEEMAVPANGGERAPHPAPGQDPAGEELQVRQTAQRLLANHLRCPPQTSSQGAQLLPSSPQQTFWPGISLDLTGATLVDFNFPQMSVIQAQFVAATFQGDARFDGSTFQDLAWFSEATFQGDARCRRGDLPALRRIRRGARAALR
jgi:Pentapeptide repeats (9 copies)